MSGSWHKRLLRLITVPIFLAMLTPLQALGGGLTMYEVGTPDTGYASAGYAARANDPGTVLTNPAGITRLKGKQLLLGGHLLYGHAEFEPDSGTTVRGNEGGNAVGPLPGLNGFATWKVNDDFAVGFGMFSNFGLGLWYDGNWVGRYYAKEAILMGLSFLPVAAYRITDKLSIGAGPNIMLGYLKNTVAINNADPALGDGELHLRDTAWGVGANAGLLYELSPSTRFGVTYTSPIKLDFSPSTDFSGTGPGITGLLAQRGLYSNHLNLGVTVPQAVMTSFYHDLNDRWAILGNFGWQQWSQFGKVDVSLANTSNPTGLTTNLKYRDTWHGALGAQYRIAPPWLITGGVAYDSSMMDDANRSPSLPLGWAWRFALGGQCALTKSVDLGVAYEYLYSGNPAIDKSGQLPVALGGRGDLSGSYPNMSIQFFSANVTWKF
ncbi:OmpP1/FadL family transporter [Geomonas sp.]|uniref:OmpP1/FadL family transporter n=1 Tax=Geomonas sp. TaxID=2651584 RepID=UPI002B48E289|nr:outer membrane protein transport protein [Geomonas sp.]HJV36728.1 outer membrane protein transport protein [Geomonas sp.]